MVGIEGIVSGDVLMFPEPIPSAVSCRTEMIRLHAILGREEPRSLVHNRSKVGGAPGCGGCGDTHVGIKFW